MEGRREALTTEHRTPVMYFRQQPPLPDFHPGILAAYYHSEVGQFVSRRICEVWNKALSDPALQNELKPFFVSLGQRRPLILGFGYTLPFMETFIYNFDTLFHRYNWRHPNRAITFYGLNLIPPDSDSPHLMNGAYTVRMATRLPPKVQVMSCPAYTWPFPDRSLPVVLLMHCLETSYEVEKILAETARVLRVGGEVFLMVPHTWTLWMGAKRSLFRNQRDFFVREIDQMLKDVGLTFQGMTSIGAYPLWRNGRPPVYKSTLGGPASWPKRRRNLAFLFDHCFPLFGGLLLVRAKKCATLPAFEKEDWHIPALVDAGNEGLATTWLRYDPDYRREMEALDLL